MRVVVQQFSLVDGKERRSGRGHLFLEPQQNCTTAAASSPRSFHERELLHNNAHARSATPTRWWGGLGTRPASERVFSLLRKTSEFSAKGLHRGITNVTIEQSTLCISRISKSPYPFSVSIYHKLYTIHYGCVYVHLSVTH